MSTVESRGSDPESAVILSGLEKSRVHIAHEFIQAMVALIDVLTISFVAIVSDRIIAGQWVFPGDILQASVIIVVAFVSISALRGAYRVESILRRSDQVVPIVIIWSSAFAFLLMAAFLLKVSSNLSRMGVAFYFSTGGVMLVGSRLVESSFLRAQLRATNILMQRVQVIAFGEAALAGQMSKTAKLQGYEILATHMISTGTASFAAECQRVAVAVKEAFTLGRCESVLVFAPWHRQPQIAELISAIGPSPVPIILMADPAINKIISQRRVLFGQLTGFEIQRAPLTRSDRFVKRTLDLLVASFALIILSPILLLTSVAILLETGRPILFYQDRKGFGGKPFRILKFRSMSVQENGETIQQAQKADSRVTKIGKVIRRTSIDELPQLINVLRGEMSIVGPRPHAIAHDNLYDDLIAVYAFRHHVKPGITGWAQVNGHRGATLETRDMEARVEHDLWYIDHWSLWLDIRIIVKTAMEVVVDPNAY